MEHGVKKCLEHGTWHFKLEHGTLNMKMYFFSKIHIFCCVISLITPLQFDLQILGKFFLEKLVRTYHLRIVKSMSMNNFLLMQRYIFLQFY